MRATGSDALAAMWRADEERGVDPRRFEPARQVGPTPPPPRPLVIMPADWPDVHEDVTTTPAKPQSKTPNLDRAAEWRSEQLRGDQP